MFFQSFEQNLIFNDFIKKTLPPLEIHYYIKTLGNNLYIIFPIKKDKNYKNVSKAIEIYKSSLNIDIFQNIFILELLIDENYTDELNYFSFYNSNFEEKIIISKWAINLLEKSILINGNQSKKFLNLDKIIRDSFKYEKNPENKISINSNYSTLTPIITYSLIFFLILIYFICNLLKIHTHFLSKFSVSPFLFENNEYYRLITYSFLHLNLSHLVSNCLSLYIFGTRVEKYMGKANFLIIYFLGILISGIFSYNFSKTFSVGASGAIFALEGAILYFSLKTNKKVDGLDIFSFFTLAIISIGMGFFMKNVDNFGHIGGFVSGLFTSFLILKLKKG